MTALVRHRSRQTRGFTLVELMVSLVAGVIIAIAVIGLARAATTSFYEQARLTSVEQTVRNASNRLRYDLTKVSFMGTGNIHLATTPGVPYGHQVASQFAVVGNAGARYTGLSNNLQGLRILVSGSMTDTGVAAYAGAPNNTSPDSIEIGGNMTTDDAYIGLWDNTQPGTCGGGIFVARTLADPATERLLGDNPDPNVKAAFTPGPAGTRHWARVVDSLGCQHFVQIDSAVATVNGFTVNLCNAAGDGNSLLMPGTARPGCGATPNTDETLRISPYQVVRWRIGTNAAITAALNPPTTIAPTGSTFMLYREMLDSARNVVPNSAQIVAEFAVDLKFGIAVDQRETTPAPNNIVVYEMDTDTTGVGGGGNIDSWTQTASTTQLTQGAPSRPGPQRVRSVRFRVSTRASMPDRNQPLALLPGTPYIQRYCMDPPTCTKFARVRTIVSEVPLINQARMTY